MEHGAQGAELRLRAQNSGPVAECFATKMLKYTNGLIRKMYRSHKAKSMEHRAWSSSLRASYILTRANAHFFVMPAAVNLAFQTDDCPLCNIYLSIIHTYNS